MFLLRAAWTLFFINVAITIESSKKGSAITSYDPGELLAKIFNPNTTISSRQRGYGLVFEDQLDPQTSPDENHGQYGIHTFEGDKKLKYEDDFQSNDNNNQPLRFQADDGPTKPFQDDSRLVRDQVTFQDDNTIDQGNKKKRRRRRKPKKGLKNYQGVPQNFEGPSQFQGASVRPGYPEPGFGPNPGFAGPVPFRRRRRPRPSLASGALTAVTQALTSIALYDDYQCVPRLLCEAAGGGTLGSNGVLDSIAGIQPLLTILSAYNGISGSPLFVFGRAVFLGMTSRGNTGTCRYAYPQCPTDPEQLIHYLNNHNGGFFRFFNAPLPNQNLEQFYNHLGQNGQLNFEQDLGSNTQFNLGQDYGQNQQYLQQGQGSYGLYQNQQSEQGYGFQNNQIGNQRPSSYGNYGSKYDYNKYGSHIRFKNADAKIEKRIQNKPVSDNSDIVNDNDNFDKWQFPGEINSNNEEPIDFYGSDDSENSFLKFPEESQKYDDTRDFKRKGISILFPENQYNLNAYSNKQYVSTQNQFNYNRVPIETPHYQSYNKATTVRPYYQNNNNRPNVGNSYVYTTTTTPFNENDYYYDHKHQFYVKKNPNQVSYNFNRYQNQVSNNAYYNNDYNRVNYNNHVNAKVEDDRIQTVYIVRGNGDPNRPEIVKVGVGQSVH